MKNYIHYLCGLALVALTVSMASPSAAQTTAEYGSAYRNNDGGYPYVNKNPYPAPTFQTNVAPREMEEEKENYVAIWGGVNLFQDASAKLRDNTESVALHLKDRVGFAAGVKIGRIWKFDDNHAISVYGKKSDLVLLPSVEGEFIYVKGNGSRLQYSESGFYQGTPASVELSQKFDLDIYAFMVNPILRVQWGAFRPYVGFGVGGAYTNMKERGYYEKDYLNGQLVANERLDDRKDSHGHVAFAFQGIAGADFFLSKEWSLFAEYKYLGLVGLKYKADNNNAICELGDIYGNHLFTAGVKFHF